MDARTNEIVTVRLNVNSGEVVIPNKTLKGTNVFVTFSNEFIFF